MKQLIGSFLICLPILIVIGAGFYHDYKAMLIGLGIVVLLIAPIIIGLHLLEGEI